MKYEPAYDGLRGVSLLLVMLFHFVLLTPGWIGVQFFFVLSGFLITRSLMESAGRPGRERLIRFLIRRTLRIFPLYYASLLFFELVHATTGDIAGLPTDRVPLWTYTYNFTRLLYAGSFEHSPFYSHFWSLCVEEQFYLAWPPLLILLGAGGARSAIPALIAFSLGARWGTGIVLHGAGIDAYDISEGIYAGTPFQIDALLAGCWLALVKTPDSGSRPRLDGAVIAAMALLIAGSCVAAPDGMPFIPSPAGLVSGSVHRHVWLFTLINLAGLVLVASVREGGIARRALSFRPFVLLGKVSYGAYVFHFAWIELYRRVTGFVPAQAGVWERLLHFVPYFAGVALLAALSWRFFERPFLRFKERFADG